MKCCKIMSHLITVESDVTNSVVLVIVYSMGIVTLNKRWCAVTVYMGLVPLFYPLWAVTQSLRSQKI